MHNLLFISLLLLAAEVHPRPPIVAVAFSPDGSQVIAASQVGVQVLTWPALETQSTLATKLEQVHDAAFAPSGDRLALAGGSAGESGAVEIWSWPDLQRIRSLPAGDDLVYRAAWSADGRSLALACADKSVRLQPADGGPPQSIAAHSAAVLAVSWLSDNELCSAGVDQSLRVIQQASGGRQQASGGCQPPEATGVIRTFDNHTAAVRDLALRPGQHAGPPLLASASSDRTVRFWQPTIGRMVRFAKLPSAPTAICWTPDGALVLAACEDGRLRGVDPDTIEVTDFNEKLAGWAHAVAASPDGKHALLAGERGELRKVPLDGIKR